MRAACLFSETNTRNSGRCAPAQLTSLHSAHLPALRATSNAGTQDCDHLKLLAVAGIENDGSPNPLSGVKQACSSWWACSRLLKTCNSFTWRTQFSIEPLLPRDGQNSHRKAASDCGENLLRGGTLPWVGGEGCVQHARDSGWAV